ncbi:cytochrome c3 family protein [Hyperthermus butylicus]|uniref:Cytochrome C, chain A n=1 Tax=Hyperthermus butylicus (strain DSM 5456 / JCM 9403 / PLM1-5) TaxID=415426 RepID=A2BJA5_HYPBU|nr:cytochrome c3 family protein [Hyperthermus butylicus]ABM80066.1 putative cytochrome C, chain A [Hyperthermus butylicus DSM 5456]
MARLPSWLDWKLTAIIVLVVVGVAAVHLAVSQPSGTGIHYEPKPVEVVDHTEIFKEHNITKYEGSKTCMECHYDEVIEVFHSAHYQMAVIQNDIAGYAEVLYGGKYAYNDFCGAIFWRGEVPINYIGKAVLKAPPPGYEKLEGKFIASGCSMCHGVSLGLPPEPEMTREQLENIDCLVCHSTIYRGGPIGVKQGFRILYKDELGRWRYMPNPNISIDTLAKSIVETPTKEACLACHAFSGGGPGFKRPNLDPSLMGNVDESIDVHLARGMNCVDCHHAEDHKFPTKSADTWFREDGEVPECTDCHGEKPHMGLEGWIINRFHHRVACQTCHIPYIARNETYPTDVARDWREAEFKPEAARYEPKITLESYVVPVYRWYNGTRKVYVYPNPVEPDEEGRIIYVEPLGSRDDPNSKIYPFKLHIAVVPYDSIHKVPVPIKVGIVFATGNVEAAIKAGAAAAGLNWTGDYVTLVRYMQVNHGVAPKEEALGCFSCHGPTIRRMPWPELGYGRLPEIAFISISALLVAIIVGIAYLVYRRLRR